MKSVLISIRPNWCELIANGKKTVEIRKTVPKLETPFKVYIYCTKSMNHLYKTSSEILACDASLPAFYTTQHNKTSLVPSGFLNGKVIGEFMCDKICTLENGKDDFGRWWHQWSEEWCSEETSCLSYKEIDRYFGICYGWHISDLKIYDKPKELSEFYKCGAQTVEELDDGVCAYCSETSCGKAKGYGTPNGYVSCEGRWCDSAYREYLDDNFALIRPPQSWCYVEEVSLNE